MPDTALEYLAGSSVRPATLAAFREHGRLSLRNLDDRVSASRRTLKRTLTTMESRGWIRRVDGVYEFTALGDAIFDAYETFRDRERLAERVRPFLEHTPAEAFDLDIDALADANVVAPDDDPTAPVDRLMELRAEAARLREYAPFLLIDSVRQLAARVDNGQSAPDVTLVLETGRPGGTTPEYRERFETLASAPSVDICRYPDGVPFAFGVADGHAFIGAADLDGMPCALLEGDSPELVAWVERTLDDYLDAAKPLTPE
ncbi:helix-turn-helix transcriptional regulator [Haloplanus aerogenes]|uniref:Uncharacterized protein n=2 Tax=Haloplanus aerogenes TaxID=660522 RepID=A0A3G8QQJ5_9EURY|nr:hypothetical protein [Haloplanus aerogenes]AZH24435.1 hypothetical protein DU502_03150 [Haloplanus aerogenes]